MYGPASVCNIAGYRLSFYSDFAQASFKLNSTMVNHFQTECQSVLFQ